MKPLLLVDVDGVLNPFPDCPHGFTEYDFFPEDDEPVRLAEAHAIWLRELARAYEIAWASGWGDDANRILSPFFGLERLPLVPLPPVPFGPREKLLAIAAFAGDRPLAWIDDMLADDARRWAAERRIPTLLIQVDPAVGLTRADVDRLLAWVEPNSSGPLSTRSPETPSHGCSQDQPEQEGTVS